MKHIVCKLLIVMSLPVAGWCQKIDTAKVGKIVNNSKIVDSRLVAPPKVVTPGKAVGTATQAGTGSTTQTGTGSAAAGQSGQASNNGQSSWGGFAPSPCEFPGHPNSNGAYLTCYDSYYLTGVTVRFYTGNDNKEYPSTVNIRVTEPGGADNYTYLYSNETMGSERQKAFNSNSMTEVALATPYVLYNGANNDYQPFKLSFADVQKNGLVVEVTYFPNLLTDAWKIEKVEVVFQVKKPSGVAHPQFNNKTITFYHPKLLVSGSGTKNSLIMRVDGTLNAGLAY